MIARTTVLLLSLALLIGCSADDEIVPPPPPEPTAMTIDRVMATLISSYRDRNLAEYEKLFDHDVFTFRFSRIDVEGEDPLPPFWGWPEERISATNMFGASLITRIDLDYTWATPRPVQESDDPPVEASQILFLNALQLVITADNPETGEVDRYVVEGDRHVFFLSPDSSRMINGEPDWKIVEWRDEASGPGGLTAVREASWGRVKTVFSR